MPCYPFRCKEGAPYSREKCFLTANACIIFLLWGGRATENKKKSASPSFVEHEKSPDRLPRSVKVKDLTPQEKVKEWTQTLPPIRTATNEAILIISSGKDSSTHLAGNLSEAGT